MTLVDTNILLDLATDEPKWAEWSASALRAEARHGPLLINDVIYAEFSVRYESSDQVEAFVAAAGLLHVPMPHQALFLAG